MKIKQYQGFRKLSYTTTLGTMADVLHCIFSSLTPLSHSQKILTAFHRDLHETDITDWGGFLMEGLMRQILEGFLDIG